MDHREYESCCAKQPAYGLRGLREAITAPTVEKLIAARVASTQWSKICASGLERYRTRRKRLKAVNAKESAHMDQASKEAVRLLTLLLLLLVLALLN
jgi:hypothetical protein